MAVLIQAAQTMLFLFLEKSQKKKKSRLHIATSKQEVYVVKLNITSLHFPKMKNMKKIKKYV
jgi:hypothetical protein